MDFYKELQDRGLIDMIKKVSYVAPSFAGWERVKQFLLDIVINEKSVYVEGDYDVDVFTVLMFSADNLQEMFLRADVSVGIPELGEMLVRADMEWTIEAAVNVLKDCMEHTPPGGTVHCSYEQNPLYTQIKIWDTGAGFAKEDIPHLFEQFYQGRKMKEDGIGTGLALSKAITEEQNGTITAQNLINAGAHFEIRFYSH